MIIIINRISASLNDNDNHYQKHAFFSETIFFPLPTQQSTNSRGRTLELVSSVNNKSCGTETTYPREWYETCSTLHNDNSLTKVSIV